jgi:photosystem II stability/assembly factor-like uncharacterized protein
LSPIIQATFCILICGFAVTGQTPGTNLAGGPPQRTPCWIEDADTAPGANQVWILCGEQSVYISSDGGGNWRESRIPAAGSAAAGNAVRLRAIEVLDTRRAFVAGDSGSLFFTDNGGETWKGIATPTKEHLRDIHFAGSKHGWIAGWGGLIAHSSDGGQTWTTQPTGISVSLESVYFVDEKQGWAAGWNGTILRTSDGGDSWERMRSPEAVWSLNSIYFRDAQHGWAAGMLGQLLATSDGGKTWRLQTPTDATSASPLRGSLGNLLFDAKGKAWVAADGVVLVSDDGGQTWRRHSGGSATSDRVFLKRVIQSADGQVWALGPFNIFRVDGQTSAGGSWREIDTLWAPKQPQVAPPAKRNTRTAS